MMLADTFVFGLSTAIAKVLPLFIGFIITIKLEEIKYQEFISFILFTNLLISIAAIGSTSQIISIRNDSHANTLYLNIMLVGMLVLISAFFFLFFIDSSTSFSEGFTPVVALLYSLGLSLSYMSVARLNNLLKSKQAALIWFFFTSISLLFLLFWYFISNSLATLFQLMSVGACLSALFGFALSILYGKAGQESFRLMSFNKIFCLVKNAIFLSFFGFSTVGMFFFLQKYLVANDADGAVYYSFLIQLFSIITFLPLIAGNILIPRMNKGGTLGNKIYFIYGGFAFSLLFFVLLFYKDLASLYSIHNSQVNFYHTFLFSCISFLACINSYTIQLIVSNKKFYWLLYYSFSWCGSILLYLAMHEASLKVVLESMLLGYLINSLVFYFITSKHRLVK